MRKKEDSRKESKQALRIRVEKQKEKQKTVYTVIISSINAP